IAEDDNFDDLFYLNENVSENKQTVNDFEKGRRYYWRVRFASQGGNSMYSNVFTFETLSGTPTIPTLVAPLNNSVDMDSDLTFSWENEGVANHYKIEIYRDSGIQNLFYSKDLISVTSITLNDFGQGEQYFWRVRSTNKNGNSGYYDLYKFRTRIGEPSILTLVEPMNSAIGLDNMIEFKWNPIDSAQYYKLEIADDNEFQNVHFEIDNISTSKITVSDLDEGAQYFWRVTSHNQLGSITVSNIFNFSTHVGLPDLPVALSPANNAKNVDAEISFSWESTINTEFYQLDIARDHNFKDIIYSEDTLTINKITLQDIDEGRNYYWRVKALNSFGNSNFTKESKFSVRVNKPTNLTSKVAEDECINLSWKDNSKVEKRFIIERKINDESISNPFIVI
ncbi:MAG: fibronectin type III domain-containing protein, partial [Melioribacteraceae bacterium]|nr:fibronectin type III domain-containing protein [Melioribacteraceae bacterium]